MTTLTQQEKEHVKYLINETKWKHVFFYGGNDLIKPCKRVQKPKQTYENIFYPNFGGKMLEAYQAAFIHYTQKIPNGKECDISHICGKNSCIEKSHMKLEKHKKNMSRWKCHNIILEYVEKKGNSIKFGPLFVTDIPDEKENIKAKEQGLKRSLRKRNKKQIKYHKCPHGKHTCFINWIKH